MSPADTAAPARPAGARGHLALAALAAAATGAAAGLGGVAASHLLTLPARWTAGVGIAACVALLVLALMAWLPEVGVLALLAVSWANLSEVLVRLHGMPSVLQAFLPVLLLALGLRQASGSRREAGAPWLHGSTAGLAACAGLYLGVVAASGAWALDVGAADAVLTDLLKAVVLGVVVAHVLPTVAAWRRAAWTVVLCGGVLAALSSYQVLTGDWGQAFGGLTRVKQAHVVADVFKQRASGPLADPNFYAQTLVVLVPAALALALGHARRALRGVAWVAAAVLSLGVVTTYSRGGGLTLALVLGAMALVEWRRIRPVHVLLAGALAVALAAVAPKYFLGRMETLALLLPGSEASRQVRDSSVDKRRVLMGAAAEMTLDRPLLGLGAGNYSAHFEEYADRVGAGARIYQDPGERAFPHCLYLEITAETGLLGLLTFAAAMGFAFAGALGGARRFEGAGDVASALLARGLAVGLLGYLASSLVLHGDYVRYLWTLAGLAAAASRVAPRAPGPIGDP